VKLLRERYDKETGIRTWVVEGGLVQWWRDLPKEKKMFICDVVTGTFMNVYNGWGCPKCKCSMSTMDFGNKKDEIIVHCLDCKFTETIQDRRKRSVPVEKDRRTR